MTYRIPATVAVLSSLISSGSALADPPRPETPARAYARHSVTFLVSPELAVPLTANGRVVADGIVRANLAGGFVVQPRLGFGFAFSTLAVGTEFVVRPGLGVGYAFAVNARVALVPTVGYDLFVVASPEAGSPLFVQRVALELPVSVLFDSAVIEPYVLGGVSIFEGQLDLALGLGLRVGFQFLPRSRPTGASQPASTASPASAAVAPPLSGESNPSFVPSAAP